MGCRLTSRVARRVISSRGWPLRSVVGKAWSSGTLPALLCFWRAASHLAGGLRHHEGIRMVMATMSGLEAASTIRKRRSPNWSRGNCSMTVSLSYNRYIFWLIFAIFVWNIDICM